MSLPLSHSRSGTECMHFNDTLECLKREPGKSMMSFQKPNQLCQRSAWQCSTGIRREDSLKAAIAKPCLDCAEQHSSMSSDQHTSFRAGTDM